MADKRLQVFTTVARLRGFTKAAQALHMTQPAITFQIRQLEEYFSTRLFDRTHNRISLTEVGEIVHDYAERILALNREMDNAVRTRTGDVRGPLVLGASTTIGEYFIPAVLGAYQAEFPQVKVRLHIANTTGVIHMVENNVIDLGIVEGSVNNKNLATKVIWDDEMRAVCAVNHALASHKQVDVAALEQYPFISREAGSGTREVLARYLRQQGSDIEQLNIIMEFGSPESIKNVVAAGLGISVLSVATLEKELALASVAALPLNPPLRRPFYILYQRQQFRLHALENFIEFAQRYCENRAE